MPYSFMQPQPFFKQRYSIWQNYYNNIPKLEDVLLVDQKTKPSSIQTLPKEETVIKKKSITINGIEYNKKNGEMLAKRIIEGLPEHRNYPLCARYVKQAIRDVGLGPYINGNGEYCKYILRANPNFKETKIAGKNLSKLPAGCIIVYDRFDAGYGKDGHVEITLGDGRACSDIITEEIEPSDNAYVFIPI